MDKQFLIAIGSIVLAVVMGLALAHSNHKKLRATHQQRLEARRAFKKRKNARLMLFYGIKKNSNDES